MFERMLRENKLIRANQPVDKKSDKKEQGKSICIIKYIYIQQLTRIKKEKLRGLLVTVQVVNLPLIF